MLYIVDKTFVDVYSLETVSSKFLKIVKNWIPFWVSLLVALLGVGVTGLFFWLFYHPDDGITTPHEQLTAFWFFLSIPLGLLLILFGSLFSIQGGEMLLTIWRLLVSTVAVLLVTLFFPLILIVGGIYLRSKRGIPFKETWSQGPNLYKFFLLNIYPLYFVLLPEMVRVEMKAVKEKFQGTKEFRSQLNFDKLQPGDVILTGTQDWVTGAPIKAYNILTAGEPFRYWTHCAIYSGDGLVIEAQADGRGVTETQLSDYLDTGREIMVLRHQYIFPEEANQAVDYCRAVLDKDTSYDFWGVSFYGLSAMEPVILNGFLGTDFAERVFNVKQSYFCSELVAASYESIGHRLFARRSWRVQPVDFLFNPLLQEVDCEFVREPA